MTNLGVLFERARKKNGFKNKNNNKIKRYPTNHRNSTISSTCFYNVKRKRSNAYKQGYCFTYIYMDNGKRRQFSSVDILKLKSKVVAAGKRWEIIDDQMALDFANSYNIEIADLM